MSFDRSLTPFLLGAGVLGAVSASIGSWLGVGVGAIAAAFFLYFFRDPERVMPVSDGTAVVAAADGRVVDSATEKGPDGREWKVVRVFLSPLDVHVNRVSVTGEVRRVDNVKGRFRPTWLKGTLSTNAHVDLWIDCGPFQVVQRQIAGVVVRRIECRVTPGQRVHTGERYGIMKFGSRMDVFLPQAAAVEVQVGQRVVAGVSIIARLPKV